MFRSRRGFFICAPPPIHDLKGFQSLEGGSYKGVGVPPWAEGFPFGFCTLCATLYENLIRVFHLGVETSWRTLFGGASPGGHFVPKFYPTGKPPPQT